MKDVHFSPRVLNVLVGAWLFVSVFLWPHNAMQFGNAWVVGLLCAVFAALGSLLPRVRHINTALAVWLFLSAWLFPRVEHATVWNSVIVAIVMFVVSLLPDTWSTTGPLVPRPR